MLYSDVPQGATIEIHLQGKEPVEFRSTRYSGGWFVPVGFGLLTEQNGRAGGATIPENHAVMIPNLLSCAAVVYIYTSSDDGSVKKVVLYHSHTGLIPAEHLPDSHTYNTLQAPPLNIHVVFASSQGNHPNPRSGIQTAGDGLIPIRDRIPAENIRIITNVGTRFGCNGNGEIGNVPKEFWSFGDFGETLRRVANAALLDYEAQFAPGKTKIGFLGSGHNVADGRARSLTLVNEITTAKNDRERLDALKKFLNSGYSYKDGSLKLFLVRQLNHSFNAHTGDITPDNANAVGQSILVGIGYGTF